MRILSHRGYWESPAEKNTRAAFERSFSLDFGTETDVRDGPEGLLIAHDAMPTGGLRFGEMVALMGGKSLPLAINIKADGLQRLLKDTLTQHRVREYFLFDMSVPDAIQSLHAGLRIFTRQSDVEPAPVLLREASGVWMDAFFDDRWLQPDAIWRHLDAGKQVCIVSPELHRRPHEEMWVRLRAAGIHGHPASMLCTDLPEKARDYFAK